MDFETTPNVCGNLHKTKSLKKKKDLRVGFSLPMFFFPPTVMGWENELDSPGVSQGGRAGGKGAVGGCW